MAGPELCHSIFRAPRDLGKTIGSGESHDRRDLRGIRRKKPGNIYLRASPRSTQKRNVGGTAHISSKRNVGGTA